jgi:hypothetical protein
MGSAIYAGRMLGVSLQNFNQPAVIFAIGIAVLLWTVMRIRRRTKARGNKPFGGTPMVPASAAERAPTRNSVQDVAALTEELNRLMIEMHEAARRIAAQIDNRFTKLDDLIKQADARIAALDGKSVSPNGISDPAVSKPKPRPVEAASLSANAPSESDPQTDARHIAIYALADAGKSTTTIAQELHRPIGEIELILNLRSPTTPGRR